MVGTKTQIHSGIRKSREDSLFNAIVLVALTIGFLAVAYPLIYIISSSFSSPAAVTAGKVVLWPVDLSLEGYKAVFMNKHIGTGYYNSIIYALFGTMISVFLTMIAAYPLATPNLPFKGVVMFLFTFTMLFDGGMIPHYILLKQLKMLNTRWAIIIPTAITVYNLIITRTFISSSIPGELRDAAYIDGCSDTQYFASIVVPLSKPVMAVITLYYAVSQWNAYFNAFLYLTDRKLFPLQIVLRDILIANMVDPSTVLDPDAMAAKEGLADLLKYSLIIVSSLPVMLIYPFIQKYFIKGVMIGAVKG